MGSMFTRIRLKGNDEAYTNTRACELILYKSKSHLRVSHVVNPLEEREAFRNEDINGVWLSSTHDVRCFVKSQNDFNHRV